MNTANDYEPTEYIPVAGDIENDIPGDNECLVDDPDAQIEDECFDSIWNV